MEEKETQQPEEEPKMRSMWQIQKESWYDKVPLTGKQLDKIVVACWIALAAVIVVIVLDALNIFNPFGY